MAVTGAREAGTVQSIDIEVTELTAGMCYQHHCGCAGMCYQHCCDWAWEPYWCHCSLKSMEVVGINCCKATKELLYCCCGGRGLSKGLGFSQGMQLWVTG